MRVDLDALEPMRGPVGGNQRRGAMSFRYRRLDRAGARFGSAVLGLGGARQQNKRQERREVTQGIHTQNPRTVGNLPYRILTNRRGLLSVLNACSGTTEKACVTF